MVRNAIELIHEMLARSKENERLNKPKFKLVPRKVQEVRIMCEYYIFLSFLFQMPISNCHLKMDV